MNWSVALLACASGGAEPIATVALAPAMSIATWDTMISLGPPCAPLTRTKEVGRAKIVCPFRRKLHTYGWDETGGATGSRSHCGSGVYVIARRAELFGLNSLGAGDGSCATLQHLCVPSPTPAVSQAAAW